jgi:biopolymer transport protein ExbD
MKIGSPVPHKKARIEIIPLIDIMFFLLAAFMLASLSMMKLQSIKMDLPTAATAKRDFKPDIVNIAVDREGNITIDKQPMNYIEVGNYVSNKFQKDTNVPVYIMGDKNATHGMIIGVLDLVRRQGVQKVSFAISPPQAPSSQ